jgi:23S rRNA pseudouridine2605 synthase
MGDKVGRWNRQGQGAGKAKAEAPPLKPSEPMRVAKAMAHAGLCSRRDAERWIEQGRVKVNGKTLATPAYVVLPEDKVTVDGKTLPATQAPRLWRYHKPKGLVTSHKDPQGRPTVFEALPPELPRVISVGRLDIGTEGLLLLTTDGALARHLELPSTGWLRRYRVRAHGKVAQADLDRLADGIEIDGVHYDSVEARIDREQGANIWLSVGLREGKNREVKLLLERLRLTVNRLIRISFGPFALQDLAPGAVMEVRPRVLADQLGPRLAQEFGLRQSGKQDRRASPNR